ncbi:MAG: hypothetical protein EHM70_00295 [Chloroflexota bacterium]|nr:MAG: hypothetical protein EHM70_00295 [Chloroflexota bacterium]
MAEAIKLAVLGGSSVATPLLIQALIERPDCPPMQVVLVGRTDSKLRRVAAVCAGLAKGASRPLQVAYTTDIASGLKGASYILNQIRVGGYPARAYDETFPHAFGIPGEETVGPGGMNNALRTIPVVLDACRLIEQVAPHALVINLTNPSSYIQYAIDRYTRVQVIGVCDSPVGMAAALAKLLGVSPGDLHMEYIGMHHFGWVTGVQLQSRDVMPLVMQHIEAYPGLPVDARLVRAIGAVPSSYLKYYYHRDRELQKQRGQPPRAQQLIELEAEILADYESLSSSDLKTSGLPASGLPASVEKRGAGWYQGIIVPVLLAHATHTPRDFILNIRNGSQEDGAQRIAVPWLPAYAIIEIEVNVSGQGFHPRPAPAAPPDVQAMVRLNAACECLWVDAVVERSYDKALRAMVLNPLVQNLDQAALILETIWPDDHPI